ncbi:hypothetical protein EI94DRAFT_1738116 [Lactarius quietus]|nr:hypothetical protein EI94DRAFT_1738116 [Lactarius quietus]
MLRAFEIMQGCAGGMEVLGMCIVASQSGACGTSPESTKARCDLGGQRKRRWQASPSVEGRHRRQSALTIDGGGGNSHRRGAAYVPVGPRHSLLFSAV